MISDPTIHVALCIHDPKGEYARYAGVTLASVFANTRQSVHAHVLHDETLTRENRRKLLRLGEDFGQSIHFQPVQLSDYYRALRPLSDTAGKEYRLLIPELLSMEKVIYLDCDVIVNLDIQELWHIPIMQHPLAAVLDQGISYWPRELQLMVQSYGIDLDRYFNSGLLIMNLEQIRKRYHLMEEWIHFTRQFPAMCFMDQDILNKLFQTDCLRLDAKYNRLAGYDRSPELPEKICAVWHFAGNKPWNRFISPVDFLYWRNLALTPWGQQAPEEAFKILSTEILSLKQSANAEISQIKNSRSWRLTGPFRWMLAKLRRQ